MVKIRSPGPKYALPSTTGTSGHDPTRTQAPAFSFGVAPQNYGRVKPSAPGPKYDVRGMNEHGQLQTQQTSILGRHNPPKLTRTPAPKAYNAAATEPTQPAFSFGHKRVELRKSKLGPGPNKYPAPTCIGPNIPDKKAEPAYSILSRNFTQTKRQSPGPKYMLPSPNVYLKTPPRVNVLGPHKHKYTTGGPGPNKYLPTPAYEKREALKGVSFGVQHSPEKHLLYLPEDKLQEAFVF